MKIATVKLSWVRSPSQDLTGRTLTVVKNGEELTFDLGPEVSEYVVEVQANSAVTFKTVVKDADGEVATSDVYTFTVGDLEKPQPDTNLFHEVVGVRDDAPPPGDGGTQPSTRRTRSQS